jgi:glycosyltransferase involved in cell wall biosynthesis
VAPRVAVTVEQFWHRVPGGTARATRGCIDGLIEVGGFDLVGVAARHRPSDIATVNLPIPVSCFSVPRPALYESWHRLGLFPVEKLLGDVDLIWASAMVVPPHSAPTVVTVNDVDFLHHPERLSSRGRAFFPKAWEVSLERADILVCPSQLVAKDVVAHGAKKSRVRVVPLGVEGDVATAAGIARVIETYDLPDTFALFVGTIEPRKNLAGVVAAMLEIPELDLVVVGPDGWQVEGSDLLGPLGARVHRLGFVPERDLGGIYAAARVFLLPSLAEGFGLPVIEAMLQGTPVVTSRGTATEEVAAGGAILVEPTDASDIERGIRLVIDDSDLADNLAERGRLRAAELNWRTTGEGYARVFSEVLDQ